MKKLFIILIVLCTININKLTAQSKRNEKGINFVTEAKIGYGNFRGSSLELIYPDNPFTLDLFGGIKRNKSTLGVFYERTNLKGHPIDGDENPIDDIDAILNLNVIGIQGSYGGILYVGPRLGMIVAKEHFDSEDETFSQTIKGTLVGAIVGIQTKGHLKAFGEIGLDYQTFRTDQVDENALIKKEKGFWHKSISAGARLIF